MIDLILTYNSVRTTKETVGGKGEQGIAGNFNSISIQQFGNEATFFCFLGFAEMFTIVTISNNQS